MQEGDVGAFAIYFNESFSTFQIDEYQVIQCKKVSLPLPFVFRFYWHFPSRIFWKRNTFFLEIFCSSAVPTTDFNVHMRYSYPYPKLNELLNSADEYSLTRLPNVSLNVIHRHFYMWFCFPANYWVLITYKTRWTVKECCAISDVQISDLNVKTSLWILFCV